MKTILHIVNSQQSAAQLFSMGSESDAIIFIENGVYNTISTKHNQALMDKVKAEVHVLMPDIQARGFGRHNLLERINPVDYEGFVDLTAKFSTSMSW